MAAIMGIVGVLVFLVSIVALIKPLPALLIETRKKAGAYLACGLCMIVMALIFAPGAKKEISASGVNAAVDSSNGEARQGPTMPPDQAAFVEAAVSARQAYQSAPNDLAKGGTRAWRRDAIHRALSSPMVSGWFGRIAKLDSNNDGKGVLEVEVADGIRLSTWNNSLSDITTHTLIEPSSPLFASLASMKKGDQVVFSGQFFPDETDAVAEQSMTLSGSMKRPEFVFRFAEIIKTP